MRNKSVKAHKNHAIQRFKERYGEVLTDELYETLTKKIRNGQCDCISITGRGSKIYKVSHKGKHYYAVFTGALSQKRVITTFYTSEMALRNAKRMLNVRKV